MVQDSKRTQGPEGSGHHENTSSGSTSVTCSSSSKEVSVANGRSHQNSFFKTQHKSFHSWLDTVKCREELGMATAERS